MRFVVLMPIGTGMLAPAKAVNRAVSTDSFLDPDTGTAKTELTNVVAQVFDPVETWCASPGTQDAMTVPELNTSIVQGIAFVLILGGLAALLGFGGAKWAIAKIKSGTGGGDGKGAAFGGAAMIFVGVLFLSFPMVADQFWTGSQQCFAMIRPMIDAGALAK